MLSYTSKTRTDSSERLFSVRNTDSALAIHELRAILKSTIFHAGAIALFTGMATANVHPKSVFTKEFPIAMEFSLTDSMIDTRDKCCVLKAYVGQVSNATAAMSFTSNGTLNPIDSTSALRTPREMLSLQMLRIRVSLMRATMKIMTKTRLSERMYAKQ